ncbi:MAG: M28 family peptidase [Clostridia bacterium]|nr:M28 family peptidase [Clostridia bacterium]
MKRVLSILLCLVMVLAIIPISVSADQLGGDYGETAYGYIRYFNDNLPKRVSGTDQMTAAGDYIFAQLQSFGYEPEFQPFTYVRRNVTYNSRNVIVKKPGLSEKTIIVGAHYDCVSTNGAGDNASGVGVTLETAKRFFDVETPYSIIFIFFGSEEVGTKGSQYYANNMTEEEIANTICMINLDSVLAGTYRYVYSGTVKKENGKTVVDEDGNPVIELAWPTYQALQVSEEMGLEMRDNTSELNYDYPTPTTGSWSDHQAFRNKNIPYLYFEASNWEVLDDPRFPEDGTSGDAETEIGRVMHSSSRDNLEFIEGAFGDRPKSHIVAFSKLLSQLLLRLDPDGLLPASVNYSLINVVANCESMEDLAGEYDGSPVYVGINQTVTVCFDGPEDGEIGIFNESGSGVRSQSEYVDGKWITTFSVTSKGSRTLSVCFNCGGGWVDTGIDISLVVGTVDSSRTEAKVISATSESEQIGVKTPFTYTVITSSDANGIGVFNENGAGISKKIVSSEIVDGQKVWTLSSSIGSKGTRTFTVKTLNSDGTWSSDGASFTVICK